MVQGGGRLRFPVKAFESAGVFSQLFWKKLQRDETAERSVLGLVDHTHSPAPELLDDAVMRDGLADQLERESTLRESMLGMLMGASQGSRTVGFDGAITLSDHPKPANEYHLKTGQRE